MPPKGIFWIVFDSCFIDPPLGRIDFFGLLYLEVSSKSGEKRLIFGVHYWKVANFMVIRANKMNLQTQSSTKQDETIWYLQPL